MNGDHRQNSEEGSAFERFAAELTDAAYRVALRHGVVGSSVDLELELWRVLGEMVRKWEQRLPVFRKAGDAGFSTDLLRQFPRSV